ncbi:MAG: DNA recombination protein RmuC [Candidatus Bostrichicola ureolyticus]|nr:MAG: DNA recombination protein RmuC [Candidatus Bostrichicola ureolyticus]
MYIFFICVLNTLISIFIHYSNKEYFKKKIEECKSITKDKITEINFNLNNLKTELLQILHMLFEQHNRANELFQNNLNNLNKSFHELQDKRLENLKKEQEKLVKITELKLEQMRETVNEKLQKTLNDRINQSFKIVGEQLHIVQESLGEMKNLASDVGGLKKILSNVKMRGSFGELQLSMLLEQILAPDQYQANVKIKPGSSYIVEFAIKLPGRNNDNIVWIPIDAKFPKEIYEKLQIAYDKEDSNEVKLAQKQLEIIIKKMAKNISEKYIYPPHTTDFGLLFLPFEGLYAEVVKKANLLDYIQRKYKIIVTGPNTLAAILNSLQIGFRTLAIQKRSSEVWTILNIVKKEFELFGNLLQKAQNNINIASNQLDEVIGKRTRVIEKQLKNVEILDNKPNEL